MPRVREKWHIARSRDVAKPPSALSRNLPALSVSSIRSPIVNWWCATATDICIVNILLAATVPTTATMPGPFGSRSFAATLPNSVAARYRKALQKHPFLLFGLPFMSTIVAGSFMLTPATALRYERYDRKNQQITQEDAMGLRQERRKVNMKDEYYVRTSRRKGFIAWTGC
jgi:cytochrome c oxidase assembly protein subunit 16